MKKEFISYEQALALKELGFDEPCFGYYAGDKKHLLIRPNMSRINHNDDDICTAPTFSQAFRWFREKYNLVIVIKPIYDKRLDLGYNLTKNGLIIKAFTTYENAELECLKKLIEIIKEK